MKEQQTRQVVQELEQLLAKAEEEATKARQVGSRFGMDDGYVGR